MHFQYGSHGAKVLSASSQNKSFELSIEHAL